MSGYRLECAQHAEHCGEPDEKRVVRAIEGIDPARPDPFVVLDHEDGHYIQTLGSASGLVLECRIMNDADPRGFRHWRAWAPGDGEDPGKADPRSGEWGPWIHERDHLEEAQVVFAFLCFREDAEAPPDVRGVSWRDVTEEFPEA